MMYFSHLSRYSTIHDADRTERTYFPPPGVRAAISTRHDQRAARDMARNRLRVPRDRWQEMNRNGRRRCGITPHTSFISRKASLHDMHATPYSRGWRRNRPLGAWTVGVQMFQGHGTFPPDRLEIAQFIACPFTCTTPTPPTPTRPGTARDTRRTHRPWSAGSSGTPEQHRRPQHQPPEDAPAENPAEERARIHSPHALAQASSYAISPQQRSSMLE